MQQKWCNDTGCVNFGPESWRDGFSSWRLAANMLGIIQRSLRTLPESAESALRGLRLTSPFKAAEQVPRVPGAPRAPGRYGSGWQVVVVVIQRSAISLSISKHSRRRLCHTIPSEPQDPAGRKIGAKKVKRFWDFVCQDVPFPSQPWPTILLTAVFVSPIIRSVETESGIGGKSP
jgi:hypothetical protein